MNMVVCYIFIITLFFELKFRSGTLLRTNESPCFKTMILLGFSLTVKAATLIFIYGCGSAISSAKEGKSGFIYNLVKS